MSLENKRVLLTGAAQGIGLQVLHHLLEAGAKVVATDLKIDQLVENTSDLRNQFPQQFSCHMLDLSQYDSMPGHIRDWIEADGAFDHLVSCAGVLPIGMLHEMPIEQVKYTYDVNALGTLALMQAVTPAMKRAGRGNMVIIGSNAANTPRINIGAYGSSKAALHMLVKCMGIELAGFGIRCNLVSPGSTRTPMQEQLWHTNYGEREVIIRQFRLGIPLKKIAEPDDIARVVLFLMSDAANHITMHDLRVDGGATLDN
jgi:2,3-dihydro-2,3-dihydroxybenzoate dehydrogenase